MKLSEFDLNWYAQWGLTHEPADEWSRPGLTNFLGSLQAAADPTSVRHLMFPPVSGAEESTGYLTLNGTALVATRTKTTVRWTPHAIRRDCQLDDWKIETQLCMPVDVHGFLERITITNTSNQKRDLEIGFRLSGRAVNRGKTPWFWGVPKVELTVDALHGHGGLVAQRRPIGGQGILFKENETPGADAGSPDSYAGQAFSAQVLSPTPDGWARNGDATYQRELALGESFTFHFAVALEPTEAATETALRMLENPDDSFAGSEALWKDLWKNAFEEGGPLSGRLNDPEMNEALLPTAASTLLCALYSRRTFEANNCEPLYNISSPRRVEACFYPNDWALAGALLAELDPEPTWRQLNMALAADIRKNNQINLLTGKGGDYSGHAWPYTIDIYNCFYTAWQLWQKGGAKPEELATRTITLPDRTVSLLEAFEDLAFDWRSRKVEAFGLADYGPKEELLECVSTYAHIVAALNAGASWMLFRLADIYRLLGRDPEADAAEAEAQALLDQLLKYLYVEGEGFFRCLDPNGEGTEVRTCWDFGMVGMLLGDRLPAKVQAEMLRFFQNELQTSTWMRALSPHDADAATSGSRADHQFNGAFGAWPAQAALALIAFGRKDLAADWLKGIARTARQGPFAQAHYVESVWPETHGGATKVTEEVPQCIHWCNISGGLFWAVFQKLYSSNPNPAHP